VRGIILSKLSLRELARAAPTCREMRQEFLTRLVAERARLVSAGEDMLGKEMFTGFVKAFQTCMRGIDAFPGLGRPERKVLIINKAGECHFAPYTQMLERQGHYCLFQEFRMGSQYFDVRIKCTPLGSREFVGLRIHVRKVSKDQEVWFDVHTYQGTAAVAMALLLAIFFPASGVTPEATPTFWGRPLNTLRLYFHGLRGAAGKAEAEDLVGPLRSLARSFTFFDPHPRYLRPGRKRGPAHPFARLVVFWDSQRSNRDILPLSQNLTRDA
jgi:hypothetical protein